MFRFTYMVGMAVTVCFMLSSCQSGQPTSPQITDQYYSVHFSHLDSVIVAGEGELHPAAFEVRVTDDDPVRVVPDAVVILEVASGPGHVAPQWGYSDTAGVVRALYYLNVPYGDTVSTIRAYAGAEPVESEIRIHGDPAPAAIQLTSSPGIFISSAGRSYSETLKATVTDRRGGPVPGRTVVFTVLAGRADVDDSLKTDHSGVASAEVHLEKNWCGDLVVVATTLHERPLEQIETGSNWSLWLESLGLMPVISRDYLLDAPTAGSLVDTLTATVRRR